MESKSNLGGFSLIKLIKQQNNQLLYWEVWKDGRTLIVHYGTVGDTGETEEIKLSLFQRAEKEMEKLAEEQLLNGYEELDEDELVEFVIQYSYKEDELEEALKKRHFVEELMNESLGWTGNGSCDGGDIGSGTINIFSFVVDVEKALHSTLQELTNHSLLDYVRIAYENDEGDYIGIYPENKEFDLM